MCRVNKLLPRTHPAINARVTTPDRNVPAPVIIGVAIRLTVDQRRAAVLVLEGSRHRHPVAMLALPQTDELLTVSDLSPAFRYCIVIAVIYPPTASVSRSAFVHASQHQ